MTDADLEHHARKEAMTMALYVAVCLLAALAAVPDDTDAVGGIVWGTTIGLALAHWFAFRLTARYVASGTFHRHDATLAFAQLAGAIAVALLATVPLLLLDRSAQLDAIRLLLSAFIAAVAFVTARSSGAGMLRSAVYSLGALVVATSIALIKNGLLGH